MVNLMSKTLSFTIFIGIVTGCAAPQITQEQLAQATSAPAPASQAAAEQTVRDYYRHILKYPDSALYNFQMLKNGVWVDGLVYGWFLCGEVNAKNSVGGYTGYKPFFVHFSTDNPTGIDVFENFAGCPAVKTA